MKHFLLQIGDSLYDCLVKPGRNDGKVELIHSASDGKWTSLVSGKEAVNLHNDGNGVTVTFKSGKSIRLDYSQLVELRALLHMEEYLDETQRKTTLSKWRLVK